MNSARTPARQLLELTRQHPSKIFMNQPVNGERHQYSFTQVAEQMQKAATFLQIQKIKVGDKVAIFAKNSMEWMIADWAIGLAGAVSVPVFPAADRDTLQYILRHSEAKAIFIGKLDNAENYQNCIEAQILSISLPGCRVTCDYQWSEIQGASSSTSQWPEVKLSDTMTIIYTSGSTGVPKGVVHDYQAYINACLNFVENLGSQMPLCNERYLSYLPLAHITERVLGQGVSLYISQNNAHMQLYFVESLASFTQDLSHCSPTIFISVPRLWQKFRSEVLLKLPQKKLDLLLKVPLVNYLIKRKIQKALGLSSTKLFASGSAPLSDEVIGWYENLDINICQGWGMTETNAAGTTQLPYRSDKRATIGLPLPNIDIRIGEEQEIQIKGNCLMKAYYKQPEQTAKVFTEDGYFRTGDQGEIDSEGYIRIIGRLKDIFKTAKGKYVAPAPIEGTLSHCDIIDQLCVVGTNLKQPVALVVLNDAGQSLSSEQVSDRLQLQLQEVNQHLPKHEKLDGMWIVNEPWTVENELLTPTLKIRRQNIEKYYASLYAQPLPEKISWQTN
ncbi:AMP-binding protein [Neptunicella marina]|uniref:AMP-binding protein n=1 Tax=Neptunicella marina TaxID=2125989 RepID=A0A8J6ITR2_9ALTE|nr:AMP-binding protein [Neptunicella marina]MBC3765461.1 AMP-binding protein [Neptunicella marina]